MIATKPATMLDFQSITLSQKAIIEGYTKAWGAECSDLSFVNLFIWGANGKMQYAEADNVLYIKLSFAGVPEFFWAPIPRYGVAVDYRKAVYRAIEYMNCIGTEPTFRSVCEPFHSKLLEVCPELVSKPTEIAWDYVYDRESLATLRGKKLHGKRNHINKFKQEHPNYRYETLTDAMTPACIQIYDDWSDQKTEGSSNQLLDERTSVLLALKHRQELGLTGGAIFLEDELVAFTLGERLQPHMQLIHIEKAKHDIDGLYPVINQEYVLHECQEVTLINREEDMGLAGMRQAKRSYQPVKMIEKHLVSTRDLTGISGIWSKKA